jgi:hypothetical protein
MISLKPGVTLLGLVPQMLIAVMVLDALYSRQGTELVLTSGNDGKHKRDSEHYGGRALDFRTRTLPSADATAKQIAATAQEMLGSDFFVQYEEFPDNPSNNHIHVQYDPKRPEA